ncbi:Leucine-rich repeat domain, L domain-like [Phytophthora cactorum]|nr:Leucine-rich repeat domain, L domain-like [Phytophthora cactorum]
MELTVDIIKRRSGHYDVSLVALLDVSGMKIRRIAQLESCVNLLELNLAHNELRSLEELPALSLLRCLQLSNNQLTSLGSHSSALALAGRTYSCGTGIPFARNSQRLISLIVALSEQNNQIRSIDFVELATKLPNLRVLDFNGNPLDSSVSAKASKAFPDLFILNGETLTLTRLLEEITTDDFSKSSVTEDDDPVETCVELDDGAAESKDDDIGVKDFINESSRHLEELLQRCKQTLAMTEPELIFPASLSSKISSMAT